jgi:hypothetical protein
LTCSACCTALASARAVYGFGRVPAISDGTAEKARVFAATQRFHSGGDGFGSASMKSTMRSSVT